MTSVQSTRISFAATTPYAISAIPGGRLFIGPPSDDHCSRNDVTNENGELSSSIKFEEFGEILNPKDKHPVGNSDVGTGPTNVMSDENRANELDTSNCAVSGNSSAGYAEESNIPQDQRKRWLEVLTMAAKCVQVPCDNEQCNVAKVVLNNLEEKLRGNDVLEKHTLNGQIILILIHHAGECSEDGESNCDVPFCLFLSNCGYDDFACCVALLKRYYREQAFCSPQELLPYDNDDLDPQDIIEFGDQQQWTPILQQENWLKDQTDVSILDVDGRFGQISLTCKAYVGIPEFVRIAQFRLQDHNVDVWENLRRLKKDSEDVILRHLWVIKDKAVLTTCVLYYPDQEVLVDVISRDVLAPDLYQHHVGCLVKAVMYLHNNRILYLRWQADGFLLVNSRKTILLSDFTCAVSQTTIDEGDDDDLEAIFRTLSPNIVPPEMFLDNGDVGVFSDVWGIGVLLYEMNHGKKLHFDRTSHEGFEQAREIMRNFYRANTLDSVNYPELPTLNRILTRKAERINLLDLETEAQNQL